MISAKVIADSQNPVGDRLTTLEVVMPRMILAEFNTHRVFSRNSASSRAIPFKRMVKMVKDNPFIPMAWMNDHSGMQGSKYITSKFKNWLLKRLWLLGRTLAVVIATLLHKSNLTKQLCNRLLEPFMWHTVLVSATEWDNFFELRCPRYEIVTPISKQSWIFKSKREVLNFLPLTKTMDAMHWSTLEWLQINKGNAEIHMMAVAEAIYDAIALSKPQLLKAGEWHIPYSKVDASLIEEQLIGTSYYKEYNENPLLTLIKIAVARCARLSYKTLCAVSRIDYFADLLLHDSLSESRHWSPFEHCSQVPTENINAWYGNFKGFKQYRKFFPNEDKG